VEYDDPDMPVDDIIASGKDDIFKSYAFFEYFFG